MIALVPFTEADADRLPGWLPSEEAMFLWTGAFFAYPLAPEAVRAHLRDCAARGRLVFKAIEGEDGEPVGHIEFGVTDPRTPTVRISRVLVAPHARGRGVGEAMVRAAVGIGFERLHAHRVELGVFDVNPRAIALYERIGFRREGVRRDAFRAAEGWWSEVVMSILEDEWAALAPR